MNSGMCLEETLGRKNKSDANWLSTKMFVIGSDFNKRTSKRGQSFVIWPHNIALTVILLVDSTERTKLQQIIAYYCLLAVCWSGK